MKKEVIICFALILVLSMSFVSASLFGDFFKNLFGKKVYESPTQDSWTQWYNRDNPGGSGDFETLKDLIIKYPEICAVPSIIECKTTTGLDYIQTGEIVICDTSKGAICVHTAQPDRRCNYDYKVRFYCGKTIKSCTDSDSTTENPYYVKGNVNGIEDFCLDANKLSENICKEGLGQSVIYTCSGGCQDGACVVPASGCNCNSCADCTTKFSDPFCKNVSLITNISSSAQLGACINLTARSKIFDCNGHTIEGNANLSYPSQNYGIYMKGKSGNTIKNCKITNFSSGIFLYFSDVNIIVNNTLTSNWHGIFIYVSDFNEISNNTLLNHIEDGINLNSCSPSKEGWCYPEGSLNNTLQGNIVLNVRGDTAGIKFAHSSNNTLISNRFCTHLFDLLHDFTKDNYGKNNTCDNAFNWNDTGVIGCTFKC